MHIWSHTPWLKFLMASFPLKMKSKPPNITNKRPFFPLQLIPHFHSLLPHGPYFSHSEILLLTFLPFLFPKHAVPSTWHLLPSVLLHTLYLVNCKFSLRSHFTHYCPSLSHPRHTHAHTPSWLLGKLFFFTLLHLIETKCLR